MRALKQTALMLAVVISILELSGCSEIEIPVERTGFYFDTIINVKLWHADDAEHILNGVFSLCDKYDVLFDADDPSGDIGWINTAHGAACEISSETAELISIAMDYAEQSGGIFDLTCGRLTDLWDFTADRPSLPDDAELVRALGTVDWRTIELEDATVRVPDGVRLDLGGIAKGYIADRIAEYLQDCGVDSALINLGGNVRAIGDKSGAPYNVGIQSPFDMGKFAGTLHVSDCSVVTAGSYQRCFILDGVLYHHILDLSSGMPARSGLSSVSVIAPKSVDADALATICFLLGLEDGRALINSTDGVEALFICEDGTVVCTDGASTLFSAA